MKEYTAYLVCAGCGKCLTGVEFTVVDNKNYCETCKPIPVATSDAPNPETVTPV